MSDIRKVEKYAWSGYVAPEIFQHSAVDVEKMLQANLEADVRLKGYEPLPDTFEIHTVNLSDPVNMHWLITDEDHAMRDRGMLRVFTSVRCYRDTPSTGRRAGREREEERVNDQHQRAGSETCGCGHLISDHAPNGACKEWWRYPDVLNARQCGCPGGWRRDTPSR